MSWGRIKKWFRGLAALSKPVKNTKQTSENIHPKTNKNRDTYKSYTVAELRRIIFLNYPPFTWEKVGLLLYKEFTTAGKSFTKLKDNDTIPPSLVKCISNALYMFYKKELPKT